MDEAVVPINSVLSSEIEGNILSTSDGIVDDATVPINIEINTIDLYVIFTFNS